MPKQFERIDLLLVDRGEAPTQEKAEKLIMAGNVIVNNQKVDKPGKQVPCNSIITLRQKLPYVSRGGLKLEKALSYFKIDVADKLVIDVGASTGGFTDCLLKNGAKSVYALDVGYGLIDLSLRNDERVHLFENTNIRYVETDYFGVRFDMATIDVSFISLDKVIPVVASLLGEDGQIIALIKPQFEAGRRYISKGVVKDPDVHKSVIKNVCELSQRIELVVKGITYSPIKGPAGNIEYFVWLQKGNGYILNIEEEIDKVVSEATS